MVGGRPDIHTYIYIYVYINIYRYIYIKQEYILFLLDSCFMYNIYALKYVYMGVCRGVVLLVERERARTSELCH